MTVRERRASELNGENWREEPLIAAMMTRAAKKKAGNLQDNNVEQQVVEVRESTAREPVADDGRQVGVGARQRTSGEEGGCSVTSQCAGEPAGRDSAADDVQDGGAEAGAGDLRRTTVTSENCHRGETGSCLQLEILT